MVQLPLPPWALKGTGTFMWALVRVWETAPMEPTAIIDQLGMVPHPEGGHYVEMWRGPEGDDRRAVATAIYFLLRRGERSHWHRVDAEEVWLFHAGDPLELRIADDAGGVRTHALGSALDAGQRPQAVVPAHAWQAAETTGDWTLVSCVVAPGFRFEGFELAPDGWSPEPQ